MGKAEHMHYVRDWEDALHLILRYRAVIASLKITLAFLFIFQGWFKVKPQPFFGQSGKVQISRKISKMISEGEVSTFSDLTGMSAWVAFH